MIRNSLDPMSENVTVDLQKFLGPFSSANQVQCAQKKTPFPRAAKCQNSSKSHLFQELQNTLISR